ncbi:MAG: metal-dependent transcriptional regulator [Actinomycetota bacterium]|nr:metal-dependent transcriptional regulator [Actinomycetota bacterium]
MEATDYRAPFREYVEAIYELEEGRIEVIQARIAEWLGVSRASVSETVHRMEEDGLVDMGNGIRLTEEGRHLAEVVVRRHRLAERFLSEVLNLPWVKVHEEASVWEHFVSKDVEDAMWQVLGEPQTCPHGNPIPGAGYRPPRMIPMAEMEAERPLRLERISEELELDPQIMRFLDEAGLRPGAKVERVHRTPDGTLTVRVDGEQSVGVGPFMAERIFLATS